MVSRSLSGIMVKDEGSDSVGVDEDAMLVTMQLLSWATTPMRRLRRLVSLPY